MLFFLTGFIYSQTQEALVNEQSDIVARGIRELAQKKKEVMGSERVRFEDKMEILKKSEQAKTKNRPPTRKQQRAAVLMVENGGNASKAMREAGYSKAMASNPQKMTRSQGFKQLLGNWGLTERLVAEALVFDIKAKPGFRIRELILGASLLGMEKKGPASTTNIQIVNNPLPQAKIDEVVDIL